MLKQEGKQLILKPFIVTHDDRRPASNSSGKEVKSGQKKAKNLSAREVVVRVVERVKRI